MQINQCFAPTLPQSDKNDRLRNFKKWNSVLVLVPPALGDTHVVAALSGHYRDFESPTESFLHTPLAGEDK